MSVYRIPFRQVPAIAARDLAYAELRAELRPFYAHEPKLAAFASAMELRDQYPVDRDSLQQALELQYQQLPHCPSAVREHIDQLGLPNTYTVATAHQPSLLLGPLYFIYKAVSTIKLAARLGQAFPDKNFVPVFVLGAEDHDFDEISHAHLFGKTISWHNDQKGAVGMMSTDTLGTVLMELESLLGSSEAAQALYQRVHAAYTTQPSYGLATVQLINDFLGEAGLLVIDMNTPVLKRLFVPLMQQELFERPSRPLVEQTQAAIQQALGFGAQAHARDINLFYLKPGLRERIEWLPAEGHFQVLNTEYRFTEAQMLDELQQHPEHFSPNVVLRPLYQELVLPNLAYIGGGGELAYWLERKSQFAHFGVPYPVLIRRNSATWIDQGTQKRLDKLGMAFTDLLDDTDVIIRRYVAAQSTTDLSLKDEISQLDTLFRSIAAKAEAIDPTLAKAVMAEYVKQNKTIEGLEERLVRAEKQRHEVALNQIRALREKLFPGNGLQERHDNFLPYWLRLGDTWLQTLLQQLDPLEEGMVVYTESA